MVYADFLRSRRYEHAIALTLSGADVALTPAADALWVGGSGNVKVDTMGGEVGVIFTMQSGQLLPVAVKKVYSSADGTTATGVVALYSSVGS
jgi:hypothetical protein